MNFYSTITFSIVILIVASNITTMQNKQLELEQKKYELQRDDFKLRNFFIEKEINELKGQYFEHNLTE